jgi:uncharacterized protein (TIGR04255 family)
LAPDSVSLHTTAYESRSKFLARTEALLRIVQDLTMAPAISRLGLRYTNRVESAEAIENLLPHLAVEAQGIIPLTKVSLLHHAMNEVAYAWPVSGHQIQARWGVLPSGTVLDAAMPPSADQSWVLDLDVYREGATEFSAEGIVAELAKLSERAYRFFRWAITPEGLKQFGAS